MVKQQNSSAPQPNFASYALILYIIAVLCVTACMHVYTTHVGSAHNTWFHGDKLLDICPHSIQGVPMAMISFLVYVSS